MLGRCIRLLHAHQPQLTIAPLTRASRTLLSLLEEAHTLIDVLHECALDACGALGTADPEGSEPPAEERAERAAVLALASLAAFRGSSALPSALQLMPPGFTAAGSDGSEDCCCCVGGPAVTSR